MSIKALVVFKDGSTRTVEVGSPAPRSIIVFRRDAHSFLENLLQGFPGGKGQNVFNQEVFRALGSDNAPIYEQP